MIAQKKILLFTVTTFLTTASILQADGKAGETAGGNSSGDDPANTTETDPAKACLLYTSDAADE